MNIAITLFFALWFFANPSVPVGASYLHPLNELAASHTGAEELFGEAGIDSLALTPNLNIEQTVSQFQGSDERVVILDYDGTLAPFHNIPDKAVPSKALKKVLKKLNNDPKTSVAIISGRPKKFLQTHFGHFKNFMLSAEHGAVLRPAGAAEWKIIPQPEGLPSEWKQSVINIMEEIREIYSKEGPQVKKGTWVETEKATGVVFHYRTLYESEGEKDREQATKNQEIASNMANKVESNVEIVLKQQHHRFLVEHDNCAIDVRPKEFAKGTTAVTAWTNRPNAKTVLCIGDGKTDEAMFQSLHDHEAKHQKLQVNLITVHVSHGQGRPTLARRKLEDVQSVISLLEALTAKEQKIIW